MAARLFLSLFYVTLCSLVSYAFDGSDSMIISYFALENDPMEPGWNKRVWNTVEYSAGDSIYDAGNGDIELRAAGRYKISGVSIVTYTNLDDPTDSPSKGCAGYCELQNSKTGEIIATGTISNAASAVPSTFEAFVTVTDDAGNVPMTISVVHQVGDNTTNVWLGLSANGSQNHVFARLAVDFVAAADT